MTTLDERPAAKSAPSLPQLVVDHDDPRILHTLWCVEHQDDDVFPTDGACTKPFEVEFPTPAFSESLRTVKAELSFSTIDLQFSGDNDPTWVMLTANGRSFDMQMEAWQAVPTAYLLLAAEAQYRGAEETANSFARMAQSAIDHHDGDKISHRMEVVDRSRYSAEHREGMMAAYRELGRHDLIAALLEDMDWIDRRSPDEPPSMNRSSVLPTTRTAPDGTVLDLTQPLIDRLGQPWHWVGYSTTGTPLVSSSEDGGTYTLISAVYDSVGPFTQDAPAVSK